MIRRASWPKRANPMFPNISDPRKALIFCAVTLTLARLVAAPYLFGGPFLLVIIFTPTIAAILMLAWIAPEGSLRAALQSTGLTKAGLSGWPLAILGPVGLLALVYVGVWMTSYTSFKPLVLSNGAVEITASLVIALLFGIIRALAEEFAWRGYMLPRLAQSGVLRAMLVIGFLQGVWFVAVTFAMPFYQANSKPLLILLPALVIVTLEGVVYGYLRLTTGSVWPVATAHGMVNWTWSLMDKMTEVHVRDMYDYTGGNGNIFAIIGLVKFSWILIRRMRRRGIIPVN